VEQQLRDQRGDHARRSLAWRPRQVLRRDPASSGNMGQNHLMRCWRWWRWSRPPSFGAEDIPTESKIWGFFTALSPLAPDYLPQSFVVFRIIPHLLLPT